MFPPPVSPILSSPALSPAPQTYDDPLMPPPPEAIYYSQDELSEAIQAWASQYQYSFRIHRSDQRRSRKRVVYGCDRGGPIPPVSHPRTTLQPRKRKTTTRKTGCKFSVVAIEQSDKSWELKHRAEPQYNCHNHPPSYSSTSHPGHRQLTQAEKNRLKELYFTGMCASSSDTINSFLIFIS